MKKAKANPAIGLLEFFVFCMEMLTLKLLWNIHIQPHMFPDLSQVDMFDVIVIRTAVSVMFSIKPESDYNARILTAGAAIMRIAFAISLVAIAYIYST